MNNTNAVILALLITQVLPCYAASAEDPSQSPCQTMCNPEKLKVCTDESDKLNAEQKSFCTQMLESCKDCP